MKPPRFSACIPAYNRAHLLTPLLDSIFAQDFTDFEVVITEDVSREQAQIRAIAHQYQARYSGKLVYLENERNLGFDGNIRKLVASSSGEYCVFMGNDDLMSAGGLERWTLPLNGIRTWESCCAATRPLKATLCSQYRNFVISLMSGYSPRVWMRRRCFFGVAW